jgi:hypothetical protein
MNKVNNRPPYHWDAEMDKIADKALEALLESESEAEVEEENDSRGTVKK